jgi:hypothetical protein
MLADVFVQKLEWFKQNEKPEVVLLVADHPELAKIIIAWANTRVGRAEDGPALCDESENAAWEWLWANAIFSEEELLAKSGQARYNFSQEVSKLIGNRILYPDGTVNSFVQRYLRDKVLSLFDAGAKKKRNARAGK